MTRLEDLKASALKLHQSARWRAKMKPGMKVHTYQPKQWDVEFSGGDTDCAIGTVAIELTCIDLCMHGC